MSLIHNERVKLLAGWLDRASTAALTVGVLAPMAGYLYGAHHYFATIGDAERDLACARRRPTCLGAVCAWEAQVTPLGIFVTFILPLLVLGLGWGMVWLEGRADRREERQRHAAQ